MGRRGERDTDWREQRGADDRGDRGRRCSATDKTNHAKTPKTEVERRANRVTLGSVARSSQRYDRFPMNRIALVMDCRNGQIGRLAGLPRGPEKRNTRRARRWGAPQSIRLNQGATRVVSASGRWRNVELSSDSGVHS